MLIKKTIKRTISMEQVENVQCDLCQKKIFHKGVVEGTMATLALSSIQKTSPNADILENEEDLIESSDLCFPCYERTIIFLKMNGAKVPSFYSNPDFEEPEETANEVLNQ